MPYNYPGVNNAYLPELNGMVAALIRDPNKFKINNYVSFRPSDTQVGTYVKIDNSQSARVVSLDSNVWADAAERPFHVEGNVGFKFETFRTKRYNTGYVLSNATILQAAFDVQAFHVASHLARMMTITTTRIMSKLEDVTSWVDSDINIDHSETATALGGGPWSAATSTNLNIRKSLNTAERNIIRDSLGTVDQGVLYLVISPGLAATIANTTEIQQYVVNNPYALAQIRGDQYVDSYGKVRKGRNRMFGLPDQLYGYELIVEDAVRVTSELGSSVARSFIKSDSSAVILSKIDGLPGDQVGSAPTTNFSTYQIFYWGDEQASGRQVTGINDFATSPGGLLSVEYYYDIRNRRQEGHVTTNWEDVLVAPETGYLIDVTA